MATRHIFTEKIMKTQIKRLSLALAGAALATLAGCGGGGGGSTTPAPDPSISLNGTAATGAAISGGAIAVKCAVGTGSATTNADGSYTVSVTNGAFPCLVKVTAANGTILHSVVTGTGTSATVNITPATQLIVASLAGRDPAAYFTAFDAAAAAGATSTKVAAAQTAVVATLKAAGVDMSALGDLISGSLKPASGTTAGNAYDVALDALAKKLSDGGITLVDLVVGIVNTSPNVPPTTPGGPAIDPAGVASLPADLLLKAKASTCSALRSTTYRVITPTPGAPLANQFLTINIDAPTLTVSNPSNGNSGTWTPVPNSPCRFTGPGSIEIVVSQAGVIVMRGSDGTTFRPVIAFPLQTHTLAEMAGVWNTMGLQSTATANVFVAATNTGTINDAGAITGQSLGCFNLTTWSVSGADCSLQTPSTKFGANADGGFDVMNATTSAIGGRMFAYRAGGGELMMVLVGSSGEFLFFTKQRTLTLPPVGRVTTNVGPNIGSALTVGSTFGAGSQQTTVSVDTGAGSFVRTAKNIGGTNDHPQTLTINSPRNGYSFRAAATGVPAADGTTVNVSEFTALGLRGMGMAPVVVPAAKFLVLSVDLP